MSEVLSMSHPKARKAHRCQWCSRVIDPGETYDRQFIVGDDGPYNWVNCQHCHAMVLLCDIEGLWGYGGVSDEDILEWEPRDVQALRWKVLWRKKWRRADGTLYPVPS